MSIKQYVERHADLTKIYMRLASLMVLLNQNTVMLMGFGLAGGNRLAKKSIKQINFILKLFRESLNLVQSYINEIERDFKK